MSASNLFDDIEGDDDIFSTPAAKTPKKKKEWMDDLLDDDTELFKSDRKDDGLKLEPSKEKETGGSGVKSGGLFDDFSLDEPEEQSASVNGHKDDEEFVVVSRDEVPSAEEAEKMAAVATCDAPTTETDGQQSDELFNQNLTYEERARIRREQRRKKAEERSRSQSNTPSPQPDEQEDHTKREQRSTTPSPSPGIEDLSVESGKEAVNAILPTGHSAMAVEEDKKPDTPPSPEPDGQPEEDAAEQVWLLTKSLQRAQSENAQLKSDNEALTDEIKTLKDRVAELEKELNGKNKQIDDLTSTHQKQVSGLEQQLKNKDKEIEELKSSKKVEHKQHEPHPKREHHRAAPVTTVSLKKATASPAGSPATKSKLRAGVDKGRPITSVADSVKKFGGAAPVGGAGSEVKRTGTHTVVTTKPKHASPTHAKHEDKHPPAKKPVTTHHPKPPPSPKPSGRVGHDKHEPHAHPAKSHAPQGHAPHGHPAKSHTPQGHAPHGHPAKSHAPQGHADTHAQKPESPSKTVRVTTHKKPHPHHHHHHTHHHHHAHSDKKEVEHHVKKMESEKKTEEVPVSKEEPKAESEAVAPPADEEPSNEPKAEVSGKSEETKVEEKSAPSQTEETSIRELEKDTTRAKRVISLFENKANSTTEEAPAWKVNAQQQREEKEKLEREKEEERQKEKEREDSAEPEKSRTSSNASSNKEAEPVVNGNADATSAESAEKETESVDGAQLSKTKGLPSSSSNVSKSSSSLPNNKNDEVVHRDNKMKKAHSSSNNIIDPKKRLMAEDTKGKRSSWAAPKREECAVCGKVVYVMERLEADKVVYHKTCFKCTVCNKTLSTGTYAALQGKTYCKVHFKQLFKMKGNYDEGFGREQHKTKWLKNKDQLDGESEA